MDYLVLLLYNMLESLRIRPARGDVEDWLPDFAKQFGGHIRDGIDKVTKIIADAYRGAIDFLRSSIVDVVNTLKGWFNTLKDTIGTVIKSVTEFFKWVAQQVEAFYTWVGDCIKSAYAWCGDTIAAAWKKVIEYWEAIKEFAQYWWDYAWETFWYGIDSFIGFVYDGFMYAWDKLPDFETQGGFSDGLTMFVKYFMMFDSFLPLSEGCAMLCAYLTVFLGIVVYRFVKSWIPTV